MPDNQNIFLAPRRGKSRFLPAIEQFADYLHKYSRSQGELAEKMYEFDKQQEGQKFINAYGIRIREAKTSEELSKVTTEAIQYGSSRGLNNQLSVVGALSQGQGNLIKQEQSKQLAMLYADQFINNYSEATASWKGNPQVKVKSIVQDIQSMTSDPLMQVELYENLGKNLNKVEIGLTWDEKGNFTKVTGIKDITGKETITSTEALTDKNLTPELATQRSQIEQKLRDEKQQDRRFNAQFGSVTRREYIDPVTKKWTTLLENNYSGKLYKIDDKGNQGEQVSGTGLISREAYTTGNKMTASGVAVARKVKNEKVARLNAMLNNPDNKSLSAWYRTRLQDDKEYIPEDRLNQLLANINSKQKKGEDLSSFEEEIVKKGIIKEWSEGYWNARKEYEETYREYQGQYGETLDTFTIDEPKENYLDKNFISKTSDGDPITKEGSLFVLRNKDTGEVLATSITDSLFTRYKKK